MSNWSWWLWSNIYNSRSLSLSIINKAQDSILRLQMSLLCVEQKDEFLCFHWGDWWLLMAMFILCVSKIWRCSHLDDYIRKCTYVHSNSEWFQLLLLIIIIIIIIFAFFIILSIIYRMLHNKIYPQIGFKMTKTVPVCFLSNQHE